MDQKKIGKFIAELRKGKGLTQAELAEQFGVSNKAVSKWENGKSLPDASIMIDLCNLLGITVNELLSGEKIRMEDYRVSEQKTAYEMHEQKSKIQMTALVMYWMFAVAVIIGITYVLVNQGHVSAGYAVVPAVFAMIAMSIYRKK